MFFVLVVFDDVFEVFVDIVFWQVVVDEYDYIFVCFVVLLFVILVEVVELQYVLEYQVMWFVGDVQYVFVVQQGIVMLL